MVDLLRWVTLFVALFDIGVTISLFERIGRQFVPKWPMRILMVANTVALIAIAESVHNRLGTRFVWWSSPVFLTASMLELVALVALYHWYGTPRGRAHAERMLAGSGQPYEQPIERSR